MTGDRVEVLRQALDEAERIARAATAGPWRYNPDKVWNLPGLHFDEEFIGAGPLDKTVCVAATGACDHPQSMADAAYIAAWDPSRVLRLVQVSRKILGRYEALELADESVRYTSRNEWRVGLRRMIDDLSGFWLGEEPDR